MNLPQRNYYPFLDGFRAIGIIMILVHHMCVGFNLYSIFDGNTAIFSWIFFKAWGVFHVDLSRLYLLLEDLILKMKGVLGVQIFLMISGFLITRHLLQSDLQWHTIGRFYLRRFLRIYPAYFLMVVVSLWIFASQVHIDIKELLNISAHYLLFLQNYFPRNIYLEHAWTLAIFEQFYFFCPLVILAVSHISPSAQIRRRILMGICLLLLCVGAWGRFSYLVLGKPLLSWPLQAPVTYFTTLYHTGALGVGCLLALLEPYLHHWKKNKFLGGVFWIFGVVSYYYLIFLIDWGYGWGKWYLNIWGYLATAALIIAAYHGVSILTRFKFLQRLGKHSYGIYLWHILILIAWAKNLGNMPITVLILGCFITSILAGVISSMTIERYFLHLRAKLIPN